MNDRLTTLCQSVGVCVCCVWERERVVSTYLSKSFLTQCRVKSVTASATGWFVSCLHIVWREQQKKKCLFSVLHRRRVAFRYEHVVCRCVNAPRRCRTRTRSRYKSCHAYFYSACKDTLAHVKCLPIGNLDSRRRDLKSKWKSKWIYAENACVTTTAAQTRTKADTHATFASYFSFDAPCALCTRRNSNLYRFIF